MLRNLSLKFVNLLFLFAFVCVLCVACAGTPSYNTDSARAAHDLVDRYASAEIMLNSNLSIAGVGGIVGGIYATTSESDFSTGLGAAFISVGVIQLGTGVAYLIYTGLKRAELHQAIDADLDAHQEQERERMDGVLSGFPIYFSLEAATWIVGVGLWASGDGGAQSGVGVGLVFESTFQLLMDLTAWLIAERYRGGLEGKPSVNITGWRDGAVGTLSWSF